MNQGSRAEQVRGLWHCTARGGDHFWVTRLSEDGKHAYGYACDVIGKPLPRRPLIKVELNDKGARPSGYRRPRGGAR